MKIGKWSPPAVRWGALFVGCWLLALCPMMHASTVKRLDILVKLLPNGDGLIEERWDIDVTSSDAKTEWYVAHRNLGERRIMDLRMTGFVPDAKGPMPFETLDDWDVDWTRSEKTGRCGINNGNEICWGFGNYGRHEYTVNYRLTNLVQAYDTHDGFNHCFVDMNVPVEQATVTLFADSLVQLNDSNTLRWAFGYHGSIEWQGDSLVAQTDEAIGDGKGRMILMLQFEKGLFTPTSQSGKTWEEVKSRALEGSDWENEGRASGGDDEDLTFWDWVLVLGAIFWPFLVLLLPAIWWVVSLKPLRVKLKRMRLGIADGNYCREVDERWSLVKNAGVLRKLSYFTMYPGNKHKEIIGALLMRLVSAGKVSFVEWTDEKKKNAKPKKCLKVESPFKDKPETGDSDEALGQRVLWFLTKASGDDLILQPHEFSSWAAWHREEMNSFLKLLRTKPNKDYVNANAKDLFELRNFLKDFTLVGERHVEEVALWDEYLVYAQLFGLAKQVSEEMHKVNPEYFKMSQLGKNLDVVDASYVSTWSSSFYRAVHPPVESSTFGGSSGHSSSSSFGGGGGFSGGGGGGGR